MIKDNKNEIPKTPSVLVLTDPNVDISGRFGRGRLGYREEISKSADEEAVAQAEEKQSKLPSGIQVQHAESRLMPSKTQRRIIVVPVSSDRAYSQLKEQNQRPITTLNEIREIASNYTKQYGVPIAVSTDMGDNPYTDVKAIVEAGRIKVQLHPILQYRDREYIENRIMQELEECREYQQGRAFGWQRG